MDKENYCVKIASHLGLSHQHMNFRGHSSVHSTWLWLFKESSKQCSCWPRLLCSGPTQPAFSLISKVLEPLDFPRFPIYPLRITVRKIRHLKGLTSPFFFLFFTSYFLAFLGKLWKVLQKYRPDRSTDKGCAWGGPPLLAWWRLMEIQII